MLSYVVVLKETCPEVTVWDGTEPPPKSHTANELVVRISYFCAAVAKLLHNTEGKKALSLLMVSRNLSPSQQKLQGTQRGSGHGW